MSRKTNASDHPEVLHKFHRVMRTSKFVIVVFLLPIRS